MSKICLFFLKYFNLLITRHHGCDERKNLISTSNYLKQIIRNIIFCSTIFFYKNCKFQYINQVGDDGQISTRLFLNGLKN